MPKHCSKDSQLAKYAGKASDHRGVSARGITSLGARCSLKIWQTCGSIRVPARASKQSSPALLWPQVASQERCKSSYIDSAHLLSLFYAMAAESVGATPVSV